MAASVEARVPYVHLPLAKVVNRLPRDIRAPGGTTKPLLKRIAEQFLDHRLIHRRKIGLWLPYDDWLADPKGLGRYLDLLTDTDGRLRAYADPAALSHAVARFRAGERKGIPSMWMLVNVEMWLRSLADMGAAANQPTNLRSRQSHAHDAGRTGHVERIRCVARICRANGGRLRCRYPEEFGWRRASHGAVIVWFKGWIEGHDAEALAARFAHERPSGTSVGDLLAGVVGHFALCATGPGWAFAAVDWVRSIPLAITQVDGAWMIGDRPERLRQRADLGLADIDPDAALAIGMAGYTIDDAALYSGMQLLVPGELAFIENDALRRHRYYIYRPWQVRAASADALESELKDLTLNLMERMLGTLGGRPLLIPLSAGRDSRLIASAAKHLGYKNVRCFTYGRAGNFEAKASQAIAERLGYRWTFVPATIGKQRRFFESEDYERYLDFADSGCSLPFVQDMAPLMELKASGYVPDDAVIVNGNSGDYISGNHVPETMWLPAEGLSDEARWQRIIDALLKKHFSLWRSLATPKNNARIVTLLRTPSPGPAARSAIRRAITVSTNMPNSRTGSAAMLSPDNASMNFSAMIGGCRSGTTTICNSGRACRLRKRRAKGFMRAC